MHEVICIPNPILYRVADNVTKINKGILELVADMKRVMASHDGMGLAAPQVGESLRIIIYSTSPSAKVVRVLVNPIINTDDDDLAVGMEGCISLPGIFLPVERSSTVKVCGIGLDEKPVEFIATGIEARVIQHEVDHLNGITMMERCRPTDLKIKAI